MGLDTVVGHDVGVVQNLEDAHFVSDLGDDGRDQLGVLQADLLDGHQVAGIKVHSSIDGAKSAATDELSLLPAHRHVGGRGREHRKRTISFV